MTIAAASGDMLDEKYLRNHGRVYMTGTQALVRLLLAQKLRDAAAGLNTLRNSWCELLPGPWCRGR